MSSDKLNTLSTELTLSLKDVSTAGSVKEFSFSPAFGAASSLRKDPLATIVPALQGFSFGTLTKVRSPLSWTLVAPSLISRYARFRRTELRLARCLSSNNLSPPSPTLPLNAPSRACLSHCLSLPAPAPSLFAGPPTTARRQEPRCSRNPWIRTLPSSSSLDTEPPAIRRISSRRRHRWLRVTRSGRPPWTTTPSRVCWGA